MTCSTSLASFYLFFGIKKAYEKGKTLPPGVAGAIWIGDTLHFVLVLLASLVGGESKIQREHSGVFWNVQKGFCLTQ